MNSDNQTKPLNLLEMLRAIKTRPAMYIGDFQRNRYSIWHLTSFITGFQSGSAGRGPYRHGDCVLDAFTFWVCIRFGVPGGGMNWASLICRHCDEDDEAAFQKFFELLEEYLKDRDQLGPEMIKQHFLEMLKK